MARIYRAWPVRGTAGPEKSVGMGHRFRTRAPGAFGGARYDRCTYRHTTIPTPVGKKQGPIRLHPAEPLGADGNPQLLSRAGRKNCSAPWTAGGPRRHGRLLPPSVHLVV